MRPVRVARQRRQRRRIGCDGARMSAVVIGASRLVSVNMKMSRIRSMVGLRRDMMKHVVAEMLRQLVLEDRVEVDSWINGGVMLHGWPEQGGGVVPGTARRLGERAAHGGMAIR